MRLLLPHHASLTGEGSSRGTQIERDKLVPSAADRALLVGVAVSPQHLRRHTRDFPPLCGYDGSGLCVLPSICRHYQN